MFIRALRVDDQLEVERIHFRFYRDEFEPPDFFNNSYLSAFAVVDNDNNIVSAGGVRNIAEAVAVTDKSFSVRARREALIKILQASVFTTARTNYDQLHAFVQDEEWMKHLAKFGFRPTRGTAYVINI